ncbi:MAG: 7TM-DISM domain-containing protein [Bacteroidota bacterium]
MHYTIQSCHLYYLGFIVILLFPPNSVVFCQPLHLLQESEAFVKIDRLELFADTTFAMTIEEVDAQEKFIPITQPTFDLAMGSVYWIRFRLRNASAQSIHRILYLGTSSFQTAELYQKKGDRILHLGGYLGKQTPQSSIYDSQNEFNVPIQLAAGEEQLLYVYCDRRFLSTYATLHLVSTEYMMANIDRRRHQAGLLHGVVLLYFLAAVLLGVFLCKRENFYLLVYVLGGVVYLSYSLYRGLPLLLQSWQVGYLFESSPYLGGALISIGHTGMFLAFLKLQETLPCVAGVLRFMIYLSMGCVLGFLAWPLLVQLHPTLYYGIVVGFAIVSVTGIIIIGLVASYLFFNATNRLQQGITLVFVPNLILILFIWMMEMGWLERIKFIYNDLPGGVALFEVTALGGIMVYSAI